MTGGLRRRRGQARRQLEEAVSLLSYSSPPLPVGIAHPASLGRVFSVADPVEPSDVGLAQPELAHGGRGSGRAPAAIVAPRPVERALVMKRVAIHVHIARADANRPAAGGAAQPRGGAPRLRSRPQPNYRHGANQQSPGAMSLDLFWTVFRHAPPRRRPRAAESQPTSRGCPRHRRPSRKRDRPQAAYLSIAAVRHERATAAQAAPHARPWGGGGRKA